MNESEAFECLKSHKKEKPSHLGQAVDTLYKIQSKRKNYKEIADKLAEYSCDENLKKPKKINSKDLKTWHDIYKLPAGIRWQVDEGKIDIKIGQQISLLKDQKDQWLFALVITETKDKLNAKECRNIVHGVQENLSIIDSLKIYAGIQIDSLISLMLAFNFDQRLAIIKSAWNRKQEFEDFCLECIYQGTNIDPEKIAKNLEEIASNLRKKFKESS